MHDPDDRCRGVVGSAAHHADFAIDQSDRCPRRIGSEHIAQGLADRGVGHAARTADDELQRLIGRCTCPIVALGDHGAPAISQHQRLRGRPQLIARELARIAGAIEMFVMLRDQRDPHPVFEPRTAQQGDADIRVIEHGCALLRRQCTGLSVKLLLQFVHAQVHGERGIDGGASLAGRGAHTGQHEFEQDRGRQRMANAVAPAGQTQWHRQHGIGFEQTKSLQQGRGRPHIIERDRRILATVGNGLQRDFEFVAHRVDMRPGRSRWCVSRQRGRVLEGGKHISHQANQTQSNSDRRTTACEQAEAVALTSIVSRVCPDSQPLPARGRSRPSGRQACRTPEACRQRWRRRVPLQRISRRPGP